MCMSNRAGWTMNEMAASTRRPATPDTIPPMPHYSWNSIEQEQLNPLLGRRAIFSENMTIARLDLRKSATVPEHHHVHEQITMVEKGALKFFIHGGEQIVRAGEILTIPPNVPHSVE